MAHKSGYLIRQQAAAAVREGNVRRFTLQQSKDMMLIAAHDAFGFGAERLRRLSEAFDRTFVDYADMTLSDSDMDKELLYTKAKVDQKLKEICGPYFDPWEVRYR